MGRYCALENIDYDNPEEIKLFLGQFVKKIDSETRYKLIGIEKHGFYKCYYFKCLDISDESVYIINFQYGGYYWVENSLGEKLHRRNKLEKILVND
jgi:hypothetical protein